MGALRLPDRKIALAPTPGPAGSRLALRGLGVVEGYGVSEAFELRDEAFGGLGGVAALEVVAAEVL